MACADGGTGRAGGAVGVQETAGYFVGGLPLVGTLMLRIFNDRGLWASKLDKIGFLVVGVYRHTLAGGELLRLCQEILLDTSWMDRRPVRC